MKSIINRFLNFYEILRELLGVDDRETVEQVSAYGWDATYEDDQGDYYRVPLLYWESIYIGGNPHSTVGVIFAQKQAEDIVLNQPPNISYADEIPKFVGYQRSFSEFTKPEELELYFESSNEWG